MHDTQDTLGAKIMYDLIVKKIKNIFNTRNLTKKQIEEHKGWADNVFVYIFDKLALTILMNCRVPTAVGCRSNLGFN